MAQIKLEEGEIGGKSREEGENEKLIFREEGEIGSKSREEGEIGSESKEKGDLPPVPPPSIEVFVVLLLIEYTNFNFRFSIWHIFYFSQQLINETRFF